MGFEGMGRRNNVCVTCCACKGEKGRGLFVMFLVAASVDV